MNQSINTELNYSFSKSISISFGQIINHAMKKLRVIYTS